MPPFFSGTVNITYHSCKNTFPTSFRLVTKGVVQAINVSAETKKAFPFNTRVHVKPNQKAYK